MFTKVIINQRKKIISQNKEIEKMKKEINELNEENNYLYEENKSNRNTIEELEADIRHTNIVINKIKKELYDLQNINRLGNLEEDKNLMRNKIINHIIKESESN